MRGCQGSLHFGMDERQRTRQFALDADQRDLIDRVRALGREELVEIANKGPRGRVNRELVAALGRPELLGRLFPSGERREFSALELCLLRESLAQESTEAETALALQGLGAYPIWDSGSEAVVERWVPQVATGRAVAAFALTEPEAGSDVAALTTRAVETTGGYVLSGTKIFISNAPDADVYTLFARTGKEDPGGVTAFVVEGVAAGLEGSSLELLAAHPIGQLELRDVFVPRDQVLGSVGEGFKIAMRTLGLFRPSVGAAAVGMAQAALDAAVTWARNRHTFGRSIGDHQAVSHTLAEMATRLEAARLLVYAAAAAYDGGARRTKLAAMAKMYATETAQWVVDQALQIHGARGLQRGHILEHLYREVRAPRIYEGTTEIQREIIARDLLD
jgi:acyl-CoA dehydrogenase